MGDPYEPDDKPSCETLLKCYRRLKEYARNNTCVNLTSEGMLFTLTVVTFDGTKLEASSKTLCSCILTMERLLNENYT